MSFPANDGSSDRKQRKLSTNFCFAFQNFQEQSKKYENKLQTSYVRFIMLQGIDFLDVCE
ncbi:CLUMA_CG013760, isoform A [Clunio marinus]|uniref:CLUMA_CG013760, isoform A n=1 Tax=Clunio marinus TaxID=568069 RepID=A0A1J1IJU1_9DIPT|nr:CLUMA_CG013760, isoform A [Clunio marinus]